MPIVPSFSINSVPPVDPSAVVLIDTSTGSDSSVVTRKVFFFTKDNAQLVATLDWPLSQSTITYLILKQDVALNVIVQFVDSGNNPVVSANQIFAFKNYSEQFYYSLTQYQTSTPNIVLGNDYYDNKIKLRVNLDDAKQAIEVGQDIQAAQSSLLKAIYMCQQHQLFFNV